MRLLEEIVEAILEEEEEEEARVGVEERETARPRDMTWRSHREKV